MRIEIVAFGETLLHRDMLRFASNLQAPADALHAAAVVMRAATEEQFDSEGRHASGGWAPLAASTLQEKARRGYPSTILHGAGALRDSLTRKFDPQHVERLSGDSLTFGSTVPYGIFHALGTRKMPRRPPVALTEDDKRRIVKEIQRVLVEGVHAAAGVMA